MCACACAGVCVCVCVCVCACDILKHFLVPLALLYSSPPTASDNEQLSPKVTHITLSSVCVCVRVCVCDCQLFAIQSFSHWGWVISPCSDSPSLVSSTEAMRSTTLPLFPPPLVQILSPFSFFLSLSMSLFPPFSLYILQLSSSLIYPFIVSPYLSFFPSPAA